MTNAYNDFRVTMNAAAPGQVSVAQGRGAVATAARQASELAVQVLQDGGNAFDAAFATAFSPLHLSSPGGQPRAEEAICSSRRRGLSPGCSATGNRHPWAPSGRRSCCRTANPDPDKTAFGPSSVCVPGTVKAFFELHKAPWTAEGRGPPAGGRPAGRGGGPSSPSTRRTVSTGSRPSSRPRQRPGGSTSGTPPSRPGDVLTQTRPSRAPCGCWPGKGERAFYRGRIAEQIVSDLGANGGFVSARDLADYAIREVEPISAEIAGRRVWTVPPEGGGAMLLEILEILGPGGLPAPGLRQPGVLPLSGPGLQAGLHRPHGLPGGRAPRGGLPAPLLTRENADRLFGLIDAAKDTPTDALAGRPKPSGIGHHPLRHRRCRGQRGLQFLHHEPPLRLQVGRGRGGVPAQRQPGLLLVP